MQKPEKLKLQHKAAVRVMAEIQSNISHKAWDPTDSYRQFQSLTFNTYIARKFFFHLCSICKNAKKKKSYLKGERYLTLEGTVRFS